MSSSRCRAPIADIAYQNKAVVYDLLLKVAAETLITIAPTGQARGLKAHAQAPRRPHRAHCRAAHLGIANDPEPSLMMPGIIISLIFSEQGKLILRATPLQNELAGALEAVDDLSNGFGVQLTAASLLRCARVSFRALWQTGLYQPF